MISHLGMGTLDVVGFLNSEGPGPFVRIMAGTRPSYAAREPWRPSGCGAAWIWRGTPVQQALQGNGTHAWIASVVERLDPSLGYPSEVGLCPCTRLESPSLNHPLRGVAAASEPSGRVSWRTDSKLNER